MGPIDAFNKVWAAGTKLRDLSEKVKEAEIRMAVADLLMNASELKIQIAALNEASASKFPLIADCKKYGTRLHVTIGDARP